MLFSVFTDVQLQEPFNFRIYSSHYCRCRRDCPIPNSRRSHMLQRNPAHALQLMKPAPIPRACVPQQEK